jgi:hypothetical protein
MDNKIKLKIKMVGYLMGVAGVKKNAFYELQAGIEVSGIYNEGYTLGESDVKNRLEEFTKEFT